MKASNLLIVGPAWVGDMVMTHTLVLKLLQANPHANIDMLGPKWSLPIVARMPGIRRGISADFPHGKALLKDRRHLGHQLRSHHYDCAYIIPNSFKSALVPWFANIPNRIGWLGEMRWPLLTQTRRLDKQQLPLMVQRIATLTDLSKPDRTPPSPQMRVTESDQVHVRDTFGLAALTPILALCPGAAFGPSKQWKLSGWCSVAKQYLQMGWRVLLLGSPADQHFCAQIKTNVPGILDMSGKTALAEAVDILSIASGVISNDSGMMHIAAALGVPQVAVYGSSDPTFTPPLNENARIVRQPTECAPCFKRTCPLGHHDCMEKVQVADVLEQLEKAMDVQCVS